MDSRCNLMQSKEGNTHARIPVHDSRAYWSREHMSVLFRGAGLFHNSQHVIRKTFCTQSLSIVDRRQEVGVGQEKGCAATNGRPQQVSARPRRTAKERAIRIIGAGRSPGCLVEKGRGDGVVRAPGPWRARWDQDANNHTKHKTFTHAHHMKTKVGHRKPLTGIPRKRSFSERASVRPQIVHLSALQPSSRFVRRAFCYLCVRYGFRGRFSREFTQSVRLSAHVTP